MHPQGSVWRKWDLHVHTPASLNENYAGPDKWETFMNGIEALPSEFEVIGINDYLFIDGYKQVLRAWNNGQGRMSNIRLFLPVVELRIDKFGGTAHDLKRVNFHVIFSDKLDVDTIEDQFLRALRSRYTLSPEYDIASKIKWNGTPTMKSLAELGTAIIDAAPPSEKGKYFSPLQEGFNNLNFSLDAIYELLGSNYFESKYLTAVGKTEWSAIQWNAQSIADKRNVINKAHLVFTSGYTPDACIKSRESLANGNVNSRLLDCSDAHCVMTAPPPPGETLEKDRIGKCFTWIKAEPTFEGLKQAVYEYDSRVRLSETQPLEPLLQIKKVTLDFPEDTKIVRDSIEEDFCFRGKREITFSPFTTCIIGGRGSGKSTLLHLLSERLSPKSSAFFLLNKLKPDALLASISVDGIAQTGLVEFLPQNEIERFASDYRQFTSAILDRLQKLDTAGTLSIAEDKIAAAVKATKEQIIRIEEHHRLSTRIAANDAELKTQRTLVDSFSTAEYTTINAALTGLSKEAHALKASKARLEQMVIDLELTLSKRIVPPATEANTYELAATALTEVIQAAITQAKNAPALAAAKEQDLANKITARRAELDAFLNTRGLSTENQADVGRASERIAQLEEELASTKEKVAQLKVEVEASTSQKAAADDFTKAVNALLKPINADLKNLSSEVKPIELQYDFDLMQCQQHVVRMVADALNAQNPDSRFRLDHINSMLENVDCLALKNLQETLKAIPAAPTTGNALREYLAQGVRFDVLKLQAEIALMDVATHGRIHVLYDGRPVEKSSFGQRCTATIVVLLRLGNTPLIIDEPEAHLDSALIAKYLVELVKQRKQHRQVIFATHNANFVVNGDSELIHCLAMDDKKRTIIVSTTIENVQNRDLILALEGGEEAFHRREKRYGAL